MSNTGKVLLIVAACLANVADNVTTYLCLSQFPEVLYEANPLANFVFAKLGVEFGLVLETIITSSVFIMVGANLWFPEEKIFWRFGRRSLSFWFLLAIALLLPLVAGNNAWIYVQLASGN